jgi:acetyltransferase
LRSLDCFFSPNTIAVIGATEKPGSVGRSVLENLCGYGGVIHPVNPKHPCVLGRPAYPRVAAVPGKVDLAVIVTPAPTIPGIVRECADVGVKGAIIISAGFKEAGPAGAALESQILGEAQRVGMRIMGPNCLGLMAPHSGLNATFSAAMARPGSVAFLSQSGALGTAVIDWSLRENVGFSAFVSVGSMLDVGWGDLISHFGDDPTTHSIVMYMESVGDPSSFLSAARAVALTKPIIVVKAGRTEAAARAVASHTGALTGSDEVLDAAFRRAGVLRVGAIEELFDMAEVLAMQPRPCGPRLAIVTNAGGPGALATDRLVASGGELANLAPASIAALNQLLPPCWSHGNPIDVLGDADATRFMRAVEIAACDPGTDGVLAILTPQAMTDATVTAQKIVASSARATGKPILASWMGGARVDHGEVILKHAGIPTFKYPDRAVSAFNNMCRYSNNLNASDEALSPSLDCPSVVGGRERAENIITAVRRANRTLLTAHESQEVLAAYDIPIVETGFALNEDEAVAAAQRIGFPVAVKLHSETITHKTEVNGVRLNVGSTDAVREAWRTIKRDVLERTGNGHFIGVAVQRMIAPGGYELILGSSIDPQFGPVLLFGAGGQLVEIFRDHALELPPLNSILARRLMERTKICSALKGIRGRRPVDLSALERILVRFSRLVVEQRWITEIEINPLLASSIELLALDVRVVVHPSSMREEQLPMLAIEPWPKRAATDEIEIGRASAQRS